MHLAEARQTQTISAYERSAAKKQTISRTFTHDRTQVFSARERSRRYLQGAPPLVGVHVRDP